MDRISLAARNPAGELAERSRRGPLAVAFSSAVPLEVLDALGLEAAWLPALPASTTPRADALLQAFTCAYTRAAAELVLSSSLPVGLVAAASGCDAQTALQGVLLDAAPLATLKLPIAVDGPAASRQAEGALREFVAAAESAVGRRLDAPRLKAACELREGVRVRVTRAFEAMAAGRLPAARAYELAIASQVMDPVSFLDAAGPADGDGATTAPPDDGSVRLMLSGAHVPSVAVIEDMASHGARVVLDDTETGTRGASRRLPLEGPDPLRAIAGSLLDGCAHGPVRVVPGRSRVEGLVEAADEAGVDAALLLHYRCCDPHAFEAPALLRALREAGIPGVVVEVDRDPTLSARDLARLQALVESEVRELRGQAARKEEG